MRCDLAPWGRSKVCPLPFLHRQLRKAVYSTLLIRAAFVGIRTHQREPNPHSGRLTAGPKFWEFYRLGVRPDCLVFDGFPYAGVIRAFSGQPCCGRLDLHDHREFESDASEKRFARSERGNHRGNS